MSGERLLLSNREVRMRSWGFVVESCLERGGGRVGDPFCSEE